MSRDHLTLITLLLASTRSVVGRANMEADGRSADSSDPGVRGSPVESESPYWEYILREYLFKTISPPPPANNVLYKELLEAPFYTGPFPASSGTSDEGETAEVLSRGDVYHLAQGGWIICQDGCANCEICRVQKSLAVPAVKWIMKRVSRQASFPRQKNYDRLQLTVMPQNDDSFHMKNLSPGSYVYVTSNKGALNSFTDTLIRRNKEYNSPRYPFGATKSPEFKNPGNVSSLGKNQTQGFDEGKIVTEELEAENEVFPTESQPTMTSTLIPETRSSAGKKRSREIPQGEPDQRISEAEEEQGPRQVESTKSYSTLVYPSSSLSDLRFMQDNADCKTDKDTRLILGRDQFGQKHLVHVVPADELDTGITEASAYPASGLVYQQAGHALPWQTEYKDRSLYRKLFQRVIDSLNAHKNAIEKFLLSPKREARAGNEESSRSQSSSFYKEDDPALNNYENNVVEPPGVQNVRESNPSGGINQGSKSVSDNLGRHEMIEHSLGSSSTSRPTTKVSEEGDEVPKESHEDTDARARDEVRSEQDAPNSQSENFHVQNPEKNLSNESAQRGNNTASLILKEVAKSVAKQRETLRGMNPVTETSLLRESDHPSRTMRQSFEGSTELYSDKRGKSRRSV